MNFLGESFPVNLGTINICILFPANTIWKLLVFGKYYITSDLHILELENSSDVFRQPRLK